LSWVALKATVEALADEEACVDVLAADELWLEDPPQPATAAAPVTTSAEVVSACRAQDRLCQ
jgi:hypothetical protein